MTVVLLAITMGAAVPARAQDDESLQLLMRRIERVVRAGDTSAFFAMLSGLLEYPNRRESPEIREEDSL